MLFLIPAIVIATGCAVQPEESLSPAQRAVTLEIMGCGDASDSGGSGVILASGVVVTTAHSVIQSHEIAVVTNNGRAASAKVVAIDRTVDLALLRVTTPPTERVATAVAAAGDTGLVVGGATSGTTPYVVEAFANLTIEEVLGTERHTRVGYELRADTAAGDSGAGIYDAQDRLVGVVFAVSSDGSSTWATASSEVEGLLANTDLDAKPYRCVEDLSRIEPLG